MSIDVKKLGIKELLFLFLNIKGEYENETVAKKGDEVPDYFIANTSIRNAHKNKKPKSNEFDQDEKQNFLTALNKYYIFKTDFILHSKDKIEIKFKNNSKLSISKLLGKLYDEIKVKQLKVKPKLFSKYFAIAAFAFRGSFDLSANFYTVDLHSSRISTKEDMSYLIKLLMLVDFNDRLNLNFRELQREGTKRATQFRINLKYFSENFLGELKKVNPYRYEQFKLNKDALDKKSDECRNGNIGFIGRVEFYLDHIVEEKDLDIRQLRKKLEFSVENDKENRKKRSNSARAFAISTKKEQCASCYKKYSTKDRSFKMKNGTWYFELHHVISFANWKIQTEDPDNYVKLCPTCHRALTPNRAEEKYQKEIIKNILEDRSVLKYVENVKNLEGSKKNPIDFVYELLK